MKYRKLGNTGLDISVIGIGTDQFSGSWGKKFGQEEVNKIIDRASELGVNFFHYIASMLIVIKTASC